MWFDVLCSSLNSFKMSQVVQTATTTRPLLPLNCRFLAALCLLAFWFCDFSSFLVAFVLANRSEKAHEDPGVFISDGNLAGRGLVISCVDEISWTTWNTIKPFTYFLSPSRFNWSNSLSVTVFMGCWSHSNFSGSDTTWHNFRCFFFFMEENWLLAEIKAGSAHRNCLVWLDCSIVHCSLWRICQSPYNR